MKIKTFSFEDTSIFKYNRKYDEQKDYRLPRGEYCYIKNIELIDETINNFINNNNIEVVDIKITEMIVGNNPPTSILVYTIMYKEL